MWRGSARDGRIPIALDLDEPELGDALAEALAVHPVLRPAALGEPADLTITDRPAPPPGRPALRLGTGLLPPDAPPELILSAAHLMAAGFALAPAAPPPAGPAPGLSPRERAVLALMLDGAPNKAIARALGIAPSTAKFHVAAILAKLGARNRSEAVALALREGLVPL